jgi:hypothetical protein
VAPRLGRPDEDARGGFVHGGWGGRYGDEVLGREMAKGMATPGDMPFGRRTWQDFFTAWGRSTDGNPVTRHMNAATKYVVSTTLEDADPWQEVGLQFYPPGSRVGAEAAVRALARRVLDGLMEPSALTVWAHSTFGHDTLELAERLVELDDIYDCLEVTDMTEQDVDTDVIAEARRIVGSTNLPATKFLKPELSRII